MNEDSVEWRYAEQRAKEQAAEYVGTKGKFDREQNKLDNMRGAKSFLSAHVRNNGRSTKKADKR